MKTTITGNRLWFFDFDGTVSHLVEDRRTASLDAECANMLAHLASRTENIVAVISSRHIDDISPRVQVPGVFVGGGSGVIWSYDGRTVIAPSSGLREELSTMRSLVLPLITDIAREFRGVEIEDKEWSVALHLRQTSKKTEAALNSWMAAAPIPFQAVMYRGPRSIEVQFLAEINKAFGVRTLCNHTGLSRGDRIFYAGDDENDLMAMALVRHLGGEVVTCGEKPLIASSPCLPEISMLPLHVASCSARWDGEDAARVAAGMEAGGSTMQHFQEHLPSPPAAE